MVAPPSLVTFPPLTAVVKEIAEIGVVEIVGKITDVLLSSLEQDKKRKKDNNERIVFLFIFTRFRCKTINV